MQHSESKIVDCVVIGGGLAGMCLAIQLAKAGKTVTLFEKKTYPFHKVCGEYVSMENWDFLVSLGVSLPQMNLPSITQLNITDHDGFLVSARLDMGGFGVSRYLLESVLLQIAEESGVVVCQHTKVTQVLLKGDEYEVVTTKGTTYSKLVCGSYGKISPSFMDKKKEEVSSGFVAIKYHVTYPFPKHVIELHNFKDGYCGISSVENNTVCICYLTTAKNLRKYNGDVKQMERHVLMKNPMLKEYFEHATHKFNEPLAISQISFRAKTTFRNDILLLGDAAGAIAPLCGNGMSMAMRSSKMLASHIIDYLNNSITKQELVNRYATEWNSAFAARIKVGYQLQKLFGKRITTAWALRILKHAPLLLNKIISLTHGKRY